MGVSCPPGKCSYEQPQARVPNLILLTLMEPTNFKGFKDQGNVALTDLNRNAKAKILMQVSDWLKKRLEPFFFSILPNRSRVSAAPDVEPRVSLRQALIRRELPS